MIEKPTFSFFSPYTSLYFGIIYQSNNDLMDDDLIKYCVNTIKNITIQLA